MLPALYIVSIVASVIDESWAYFYFLSVVESALLLLIIWEQVGIGHPRPIGK